jgi:hypothetical protein
MDRKPHLNSTSESKGTLCLLSLGLEADENRSEKDLSPWDPFCVRPFLSL